MINIVKDKMSMAIDSAAVASITKYSGMLLLAASARYLLLPPQNRKFSDWVAGFILAAFAGGLSYFISGHLQLDQDLKIAVFTSSAFLAQDILKGVLQRIFPALMARLESGVRDGK